MKTSKKLIFKRIRIPAKYPAEVRWPWGRYRNQSMNIIPRDYLTWASQAITDVGIRQLACDELKRRNKLEHEQAKAQ